MSGRPIKGNYTDDLTGTHFLKHMFISIVLNICVMTCMSCHTYVTC